ncbi:MAG: hypothetical protein ACTSXU_12900 [Promethearchaeota archaeon]
MNLYLSNHFYSPHQVCHVTPSKLVKKPTSKLWPNKDNYVRFQAW